MNRKLVYRCENSSIGSRNRDSVFQEKINDNYMDLTGWSMEFVQMETYYGRMSQNALMQLQATITIRCLLSLSGIWSLCGLGSTK